MGGGGGRVWGGGGGGGGLWSLALLFWEREEGGRERGSE